MNDLSIQLIINLHKENQRQGPGSDKDTLRAFDLTKIDPRKEIKIADIGSGTGAQTLVLAKYCNCKIIAVDLFPEFLSKLKKKAKSLKVENKVSTLVCRMDNLPFKKKEFDLIWSEGAIYNMGFENGIKYWKQFIKKGGYLVLSEITWITNTRPKALEKYWQKEYPQINKASDKIRIFEDNGYILRGYFNLGQDSWIENYYKPLANNFEAFLKQYGNSYNAEKIIQEYKTEIKLYEKYKDYYTYGFYIVVKE